jgi:hypothetical protein
MATLETDLTKLAFILCLNATFLLAAGPPITTSQYNNMRSGANLNEQILTPEKVNAAHFGKLLSLPVDGDVYAQPLYLPHVAVPGKGLHNLIFVATEHDSVYAFDAEGGSSAPLWHVKLLSANNSEIAVPDRDVQCPFITPEIGITSTPVIDLQTGTLYVLARSRTQHLLSYGYSQRLHALAITTGAEKFGGPVEIRASVMRNGNKLSFNPLRENPRAALLLVKGSVYLTWASSCDIGPYHGWIMAYNARSLRQQAVFNTSLDSSESGIWMSDTGPVADQQGNVYVVTGNGHFDANLKDGQDYGDSVLKLSLRGNQLLLKGYFTPFNQEQLNSSDGDLGSGGPLLLPARTAGRPNGLVFGGKAGILYVADPTRMRGLQADSGDASIEQIPLSSGIYSAPAYWNDRLYCYAADDALKAFAVEDGRLSGTPVNESRQKAKFSGATPTVSSNGSRNGVVWLVETKAWNATRGQAVLRAYDASDVSKELYSSDENPARDHAGEALRFTIPTVAGGRVYIGVKKAVDVYGLLPR